MDEAKKVLADRLIWVDTEVKTIANKLHQLSKEFREASEEYTGLKQMQTEIKEALIRVAVP